MTDQKKLLNDIRREATSLWTDQENKRDDGGNRLPGEYSLRDFTHLSGEAFVSNAYLLLAGRQADESGLRHYSKALVQGRLTKPLVLGRIRYSREGRAKGVMVRNLLPTYCWHLLFMIPLLGRLFATIDSLFCIRSLGVEIEHLRGVMAEARQQTDQQLKRHMEAMAHQEERFGRQIQRNLEAMTETMAQQEERLDRRIQLTMEAMAEAAAQQEARFDRQLKLGTEAMAETTARQEERLDDLDARFLKVSSRRAGAPDALSASIDDEHLGPFYLAFEERFRGTAAEVRNGLHAYLPFALSAMKRHDDKAVDLGCGRCEWLGLLRDNGLAALGVDSNPALADYTREQGMEVIIADIFAWFTTIANDSFCLVTSFHLIEHLPFLQQVRLLDEIFRVLKPGGIAILESPNMRNILVGGGDFFRDPTHIQPIFPDTLGFLGQSRGFVDSQVFFFTPTRELIPVESVAFDSLEAYVNVSRDFSWIGAKPQLSTTHQP